MIKFKDAVLINNKSLLFTDLAHEEKESYIVITTDQETIKVPYSNISCITNKTEKKVSLLVEEVKEETQVIPLKKSKKVK